MVQNQTLEQD